MRSIQAVFWLFAAAGSLTVEAANRLENPSFENGRDSWFSLASPAALSWNDFSIDQDPQEPTQHCARLDLACAHAPRPVGIWGAVQEVTEAQAIPRYLRGRYFVRDWRRGTKHQYVQVVLNVWATTNYFGDAGQKAEKYYPVQLAFVLCGIDEAPFAILNRKFVLAGPVDPQQEAWIDFDFDLHEAFRDAWGYLPDKFRGLRLFCEVRFDGRTEDEQQGQATVFFDDLYLGDDPS